jgi:hypothetical protein
MCKRPDHAAYYHIFKPEASSTALKTLKIDATCSCEKLLYAYKTTRCQNPRNNPNKTLPTAEKVGRGFGTNTTAGITLICVYESIL